MNFLDVLSECSAEGWLHVIREGVIACGTALDVSMAYEVRGKSKASHGETIISVQADGHASEYLEIVQRQLPATVSFIFSFTARASFSISSALRMMSFESAPRSAR